MKNISSARLLILFAIAFSFSTLPGLFPVNTNNVLPRLPTAHAFGTAVQQPWIPAGPETDTVTYTIYTDETAEFTAFQNKQIDVVDWPISPTTLVNSLAADNNFIILNGKPISDQGYFELEFNEANNYFGCNFNFGNAACGTDIRQAFAHAVDKVNFVTNELQNQGQAIDSPVPPSVELNHPNPCGWDASYPQSGSSCVVNAPGGTAYHLQAASPCGLTSCTSTPQFSYITGLGTPDFCAAAYHLVHSGVFTGATIAATLDANGKPIPGTGTCRLLTIPASVAANPIHIFVRSDNTPRLHVGEGYAQFMCALLTGTFSTGCPSAGVIQDLGPITAFCGFTTSPTNTNTCWWAYTAGFGGVGTEDSSMYFGYHSKFVDGIPSIKVPTAGAFCDSTAVPSFAAPNYLFLCNPSFDSLSTQGEFAPCLTTAGDPVGGQITPTFGTCPSTTQLSAASAFYQAENTYGSQVYSIAWYSGINIFGYQNNGWHGLNDHHGNSYEANTNFFAILNAWCDPNNLVTPFTGGTSTCANNPANPTNALRQGFKQSTGSINPFIGNTVWDAGVLNALYDGPGATDPYAPQTYLDWMTYRTDFITCNTGCTNLGYVAPTGTVGAFRYTLRQDIFFHDGQQLTAWDMAFSYSAFRSAGVGAGLAPMNGIKVLNKSQLDVDVNSVGPNTKLFLSAAVIPGHTWSGTCSASTWNSGAALTLTSGFAAADAALKPCIAPATSITASGVIVPDSSAAWHSNVDSAKIAPSYDNTTPANDNLIGSSAWECISSGSGVLPAGAVGGDCSSSHNDAPPVGGTWTLSAYGKDQCQEAGASGSPTLCSTHFPGPSQTYFRSKENLALYIWTNNDGRQNSDDFTNLSVADGPQCFGKPVPTTGCGRWQQGIGNPGKVAINANIIGEIERFYQLNWLSPFDWASSPPDSHLEQNIGTCVSPPGGYQNGLNSPASCPIATNPATSLVFHINTFPNNRILVPCSVSTTQGYDC